VLVLTHGAHGINAATARILTKALEDRIATVDIMVDLHGDGIRETEVRIVTAHVVMLIPDTCLSKNDAELFGILSGKIRRLRG
jgi:hypothetical protein